MFVTFEKGPYIPAYGKSNLIDLYLELATSNKPTVDEMGTVFTGQNETSPEEESFLHISSKDAETITEAQMNKQNIS